MKVLFDNAMPFSFAHGGAQTQIEETMAHLRALGVDAEPLRWWDGGQKGDILHYFGIPPDGYREQAELRGLRVVCTHLLTAACNRPERALLVQSLIIKTLVRAPGLKFLINQTTWPVFPKVRHFLVGLEAEKHVLTKVFGVDPARVSLVPLGLPEEYLHAGASTRQGGHLITTGTITPRKRSLELARMAREAQVPLLFVGKAYAGDDPYGKAFAAEIDDQYVRHHPHVESNREMIELLQAARGFVIFSQYENWCLSAHEAAACGLPLLLPDQNWSRERFGEKASYLVPGESVDNPARLRKFYEQATGLPVPAKPQGWQEAAVAIKEVYSRVLAEPR